MCRCRNTSCSNCWLCCWQCQTAVPDSFLSNQLPPFAFARQTLIRTTNVFCLVPRRLVVLALHQRCVSPVGDDWSQWSPCTATCSDGTTSRTKDCVNELNNTRTLSETGRCNAWRCDESEWKIWTRMLVQATIYRRLRIGRDGHFDQSEPCDISQLVREYGFFNVKISLHVFTGNNIPANMRYSSNVALMMGQRRRRWTNIEPSLGHYTTEKYLLIYLACRVFW